MNSSTVKSRAEARVTIQEIATLQQKGVDYAVVHPVETVILQMRRTKVYLMVAN